MEMSQRDEKRAAVENFPGICRLLDYFRLPSPSLSQDVEDLEQAVEQLNQEGKLLFTPTLLEGDWYRTSVGPFLVEDEGGISRAVLPDGWGRYYFKDEATGKRIYLGKKNPGNFQRAYSATADFPKAKLSFASLIFRLAKGLSLRAGVLLVLLGFLGGALWALFAYLTRQTLSSVMLLADGGDLGALWFLLTGVFLLLVLLVFTTRRIIERAADKGAILALPALLRRMYEGDGGGEETAESLAHFRDNSRHMIGWIFSGIWSLCVLAWVLPFFHGKTRGWSLLTMAALFLVAVLVFFLARNRKKGAKEERQRRQWVLRRADDRRLGICRPFPGEKKPVEKWNHIGGSFWIALLLALPVVAWMVSDGRSAGRLMQNLLLYLPFAALPLQQVLSATGAGRATGELRSLLPRAKKKPGGQATLPSLGSVMEWKDVTFSYPDSAQPVLQGVSLRLNPGDRVGIYGGTGAGKTTFCRLAAGLQRPTGGNIYYGGVELGRYNGAALRSRVAWETGRDIVLGSTLPSQADERTFVVLSPRMEDLRGCQRIYRLEEGRLIPVDEKQIG